MSAWEVARSFMPMERHSVSVMEIQRSGKIGPLFLQEPPRLRNNLLVIAVTWTVYASRIEQLVTFHESEVDLRPK